MAKDIWLSNMTPKLRQTQDFSNVWDTLSGCRAISDKATEASENNWLQTDKVMGLYSTYQYVNIHDAF